MQRSALANKPWLSAYPPGTPAEIKVPKHVEFRSGLPKTHVGKILRRELEHLKSSQAA